MTARSRRSNAPLLDTALARFIRGPVAINLASHDATHLPSIARGYGCRVSADRRQITVFLSLQSSGALLRDLREHAPIAVAFCRPMTHETMQFKGTGAEIVPLGPDDRAIMLAYGRAFYDEIVALGYSDPFTRGLVAPTGDDAVSVVFTPNAVFDQTPGPGAGKPLGPRR